MFPGRPLPVSYFKSIKLVTKMKAKIDIRPDFENFGLIFRNFLFSPTHFRDGVDAQMMFFYSNTKTGFSCILGLVSCRN